MATGTGSDAGRQAGTDGFASPEAGRVVIGSWQEEPGSMEIHPVPPAPTQERRPMSQQGQWQGQAARPAWPQGAQQRRPAPQAGQAQAWPVRPSPSPMAGNPYPQQGRGMPTAPGQYPQMGMGQVPAFRQPRRKSGAPLAIFLLFLVAVGVGVFLLTRLPDEPGDGIVHDRPIPGDDGGVGTARDPFRDDGMQADADGVDAEPSPTASEDFLWADAPWVEEGHIPERATQVTDLESVLGGWKGYVRYLPVAEGDSKVEEFLSVHVDVSQTSTTFRFDWDERSIDGGARQPDDSPDAEFLGTWDGDAGAIYATEASGNLEMRRFWYEDGRQYAYGTLQLPDGTVGSVYLTR